MFLFLCYDINIEVIYMASINDIVTVNVNNYDKFLDKSADPDRALKKNNFEARLNALFATINGNSFFSDSNYQFASKMFSNNFNKLVKELCNFKDDEHKYAFSTIDRLINDELSELERNVNLLDKVTSERDIRNVINKYGLCNKIDVLFDEVIVNGQSIKSMVSSGLSPSDVVDIVSGIEGYVLETKKKYKEETIQLIKKYLDNASGVITFNETNSTDQMKGSFTNFSTELILKNLYLLLNIDKVIEQKFSSIIGVSDVSKVIPDDMDNVWMGIKAQDMTAINAVKELYPDKEFSGKVSGHHLYAILTNFLEDNEKVKTFIKYKMMLLYSDDSQKVSVPTEDEFVTAKDIMLMFRDFRVKNKEENDITELNAQMVVHSNDFDGERYVAEHLSDDDVRFNLSFAIAAYEALYHELKNYSDYTSSNVPSKYSGISNVYSDDLDTLIKDSSKESVLDSVISYPNNSLLLDLDKKDFYTLIRYFSFDEVKWMVEEIDKSPRSTTVEEKKSELKQLIYYCSFFKTYEEDNIKFDSPKYERINKLFNMIKTTNDVSLLGRQFEEWFKSIDINSLSEEEFEVLSNVDYQYIYNQLDYASQVIYQKCKKYGVKFHMGYKDMIDNVGVKVDETVEEALNLMREERDDHNAYSYLAEARFNFTDSIEIEKVFRIFKDTNAVIPGYVWGIQAEYLEELLKKYPIDLTKLPHTYVPIIFKIPLEEFDKYIEEVGGDFNNLLYIPCGSDISIFDGVKRVIDMYGVDYSDIPNFPMEAFRCSEARLGFLKKVFEDDIDKLKKLPGIMYAMKYDDLLKIVKKKKGQMFDDKFMDWTLKKSNHSSDEVYGGFYREFTPEVKGKAVINIKVSPFFRNYCDQFVHERKIRQKMVLERTNGHREGNFVMTDYMLFKDLTTFRILLYASDNVEMFFGLNPALFELGSGKLKYLIKLLGGLKELNKMPSSFFNVPMETIKLIYTHPRIDKDLDKLKGLPSTFFDLIYYNEMDLEVAFNSLDMLKEIEDVQKSEEMVPLDGKGIMINVKLVNDFLGKEEYEFKDYMLYKDTYELINLLPMFQNVYENNPMLQMMGLSLEDILSCLKLDINLIDTEEKILQQVLRRTAEIMKEKGTINIDSGTAKK